MPFKPFFVSWIGLDTDSVGLITGINGALGLCKTKCQII
jgi:hypothetical protein